MNKQNSVRLRHDELVLGPVTVSFQRTLRIPEQGLHPLPPGLGRFPLRRVEDYPTTAPAEWLARGGIMLPLYQREALWLSFDADEPAALQVGTGRVCAVSGGSWNEALSQDPQNYVVLPDQPWLDGINAGDGFIRQFVAVPLGSGATVEEQVTGEAVHGGVQLRAVGLTAAALEAWEREPRFQHFLCAAPPDMGLAVGGRMEQEIYEDDRDLTDYDLERTWSVNVYLCSVAQWTAITGELPPPSPIDRDAYIEAGLPWFDYFDADRFDLSAPESLRKIRTVGDLKHEAPSPFTPVPPSVVISLKDAGGTPVHGETT